MTSPLWKRRSTRAPGNLSTLGFRLSLANSDSLWNCSSVSFTSVGRGSTFASGMTCFAMRRPSRRRVGRRTCPGGRSGDLPCGLFCEILDAQRPAEAALAGPVVVVVALGAAGAGAGRPGVAAGARLHLRQEHVARLL